METQLEQERFKELFAEEKEDDGADFRNEHELEKGGSDQRDEMDLHEAARVVELEEHYAEYVEELQSREMMSDEVNIMRKEPTPDHDRELVKDMQKTME